MILLEILGNKTAHLKRMHTNKGNLGFTLVEFLIVIAISIILVAASVPIFGNFQVSAQLNENSAQIAQTIKIARERSVSGLNNVNHGVHFGSSSFTLYEGDSYATRNTQNDRTVVLDSVLLLSTTLPGNNVVFSKGFGIPNYEGTVTVAHSVEGIRTIDINSLGIIKIEKTIAVTTPTTLITSPSTLSFSNIGQTSNLTTIVYDQNGGILSTEVVTYTSSNTSVATVNSSGLVTSVGAGSLTITAISGSLSDTTSINVTVPVVLVPTSVTVTPPTLTFTNINQTSQLTATVYDQNGDTMPSGTVTYTSSNTSIATVNSSGLVTSKGVGSATITASSGSLTDTTSVNVTVPLIPTTMTLTPASLSFNNVSQTAQFTTEIYDQNGDLMIGQSVTYTSSNTLVATVNSSGLVTSKGAGSATITATSGSLSDTTSVSVTVPTVLTPTTLLLLPSGLSFNNTNQTSQLTATVYDQNGDAMTGQSIIFSSSNVAIAAVSGTGLVTSKGFGSATITARSGSLLDTTNVSVVWRCTGRFCNDLGGGF